VRACFVCVLCLVIPSAVPSIFYLVLKQVIKDFDKPPRVLVSVNSSILGRCVFLSADRTAMYSVADR